MTAPLILASGSPRRRQLLQNLNLSFEVHPVDADENLDPKESRHPALYIAERKANLARSLFPDRWILTCDTVVESKTPGGPTYLGKAENRETARKMLQSLSGTDHIVRTGHCLVSPDGNILSAMPYTTVRFRPLSDDLLDWYLDTGEWTDKAGAYGIQEKGAILIDEIHGDYFNVVGLSVKCLDELFEKAGTSLGQFRQ